MSEHLSKESIQRYTQRELTGPDLLTVDDHISECNACFELVGGSERVSSAAGALIEGLLPAAGVDDDHLTHEQLAALADDESDAVSCELADVHLGVCQQCSEELADLQDLKTSIPVPDTKPGRGTSGELLQFTRPWRQLYSRNWLRAAAAVLVVLASAAVFWFVWKSLRQPPAESAQSVPPAILGSPTPSVAGSPASTPEALVVLNDAGGQVTLDEAGNVVGLGALTPSLHEAVKNTLTNQQINVAPALQGLSGKSGTLMGAPGEGSPFALLNPVGRVVRSDRPTFQWRPLAGAGSYVVKVYDLNFKEVATSPAQAETMWQVNESLSRGGVFVWQVTAIKDGEEVKSPVAPAPEARFRVLGRESLVELEHAERTHANSHLVLGTVYAQAGLLDDAAKEFRLLLRANPDSPVVEKLLQSVSKQMRSKRAAAKP